MAERVLMIEDDARLAEMVGHYLGPHGFDVEVCGDGTSGLERARSGSFGVLILDVMLPDIDGFEVCRRLRRDSDLPVIMLTARGDETDRIVGLELGADDYLPKPFNPRELLARLRAVLRRRSPGAGDTMPILRFGRLEIDRDACLARIDGAVCDLTGHQFELLRILAESAGRAVSRETLMERLTGDPAVAFDRSIDVHVPRIIEGFAELAAQEIAGPTASPTEVDESLAVPPRHAPHAIGPGLIGTLVFAAAIGVGAYPISRRITRRLERLRGAVDQLGEGALDARVPVEGKDEVAQLAESFNRSASRVERLVHAQGRVLASASHELRSPLTRLRVSLELMGGGNRPDLVAGAEQDIEELDALIDDVLLAARIESGQAHRRSERVDLRKLLEEEASREGARVSATDAELLGDPRLLRRMLRNLFENASRHAGGHDVEADLTPVRDDSGRAVAHILRVFDRGPGVPESERISIFEPFHRPTGHSEGRDGGVGLGLALVRDIARQHGGDACCLAREGGGSVFEITLSVSPLRT